VQLETVSDEADVAFVGVEQVDGPVLCLITVVPEWAGQLDLESPFSREEQVWRPLGSSVSAIRGQRIEVLGDGRQELRLTIWANTRLKVFERDATAINSDQRCSNVIYYPLELHEPSTHL
jgi:hypothetical protein